jgi:predicted phage baseplate assembly protein
VNANTGLATNGASVSEVMGNGAAATTNQKFSLKQTPLTFTQAATPTGRQSTLQVQANQVSWSEVPSLYGQPGNAAVFATLNQPGGNTDVLFGDGAEGATLPTGTNNIQANYRVGGGAAGNVAAGAITTLLDRPVGVNGVSNPLGATGGQDAQNVAGIRASAPQTVLTLGRAVSISDYQNFAASFAGIAKAAAIWIPSGPGRGVFITVAGVNGVAMPPGTPTLTNLVAALQGYGNPLMPIHVASFVETLFGLSANLTYDPAYQIPLVQAQVQQCLATSFGFASRKFGQGVSADQITAVIQAVPGVIAVNVAGVMTGASSYGGDLASEGASYSLSRYIQWQSQPATVIRPAAPGPNHICPYIPSPSTTGLPMAAEILVLDPRPGQVTLGTMP